MEERQSRENLSGLKTLKGKVRRRITGDENKGIRVATQEKMRTNVNKVKAELQKPKVIRMIDRIAFCNGVFGIVITQFAMLKFPQWFWAYYATVITPLLVTRYFMYKQEKMQYFMLDFCYFVQATHLFESVFPSKTLFTINFLFANGPLALAIIAWRNSLVFHSLDKVTSVYIHALPLCLSYCDKWFVGKGLERIDAGTFFMACCIYLGWQTLYLFETEVRNRKRFVADKNLSFSLRWLAEKGHNIPSVMLVRRFLVAIGVFTPTEPFEAESLKTKMVMVLSQLIFTLFSMLVALSLYQNEYLHAGYSLVVLGWSVWNGAQYYFEVFAGNYEHRVVKTGASPQEPHLCSSSSDASSISSMPSDEQEGGGVET
eukprot:TRINITY_DN6246_c0_g2_i1.p1 TRINITY_DN6246_c0_g2~~TRINITY_DN6246_c0_g2_i1.p1  ORF type:complete len:397 (+),score=79.45 TRINITY_DN6246_c0_g2_i1:76-1191(+)